jgi:hypothetical protein
LKRGSLPTAEGNIVEVGRCLDSLHLAADIEIFDLVAEIGNGRMSGIVGTEDLNSLFHSVRSIHIFDYVAVREF